MIRMPYRGAVYAVFALGALVAACGDDTALGPADVACTAGSLSAGSPRSARISASDCEMWHDYNYELQRGEAWTLRTAKDRAYIVRMTPVAVDGGDNTLNASLYLYGRNAAGDAVFVSGYNRKFGASNLNGGRGSELIIPSHAAATYSVRVILEDATELGAYEIELLSCPMLNVNVGTTSAAVAFDDTCITKADESLADAPVAFFSFDAQESSSYTLTGTRTAGTATHRFTVRGVGADFGCYISDCVTDTSPSAAGPTALGLWTNNAGAHTVMMTQTSAGSLTATLGVVLNPPTIVAPTSLQR